MKTYTLHASIPMGQLLSRVVIGFSLTALLYSLPVNAVHSPVRSTVPPDGSGWLAIDQLARETKTLKHDPHYKKGKEAYLGKGKHQKYQFCVVSEGKKSNPTSTPHLEPLTRKTARPYRKSTVVDFVAQLYDCEKPDHWVLNNFDKQTAGYIVYYLNKRFKLKLQQ